MGNLRVSVVIEGLEARFYDEILDLVTLFQYCRNARILAPVVGKSGEVASIYPTI